MRCVGIFYGLSSDRRHFWQNRSWDISSSVFGTTRVGALYSWGVKTALCKISRFFDENPWRNKSSKLNIFGPLFPKTHSAMCGPSRLDILCYHALPQYTLYVCWRRNIYFVTVNFNCLFFVCQVFFKYHQSLSHWITQGQGWSRHQNHTSQVLFRYHHPPRSHQ